jgi:hypothetical protein
MIIRLTFVAIKRGPDIWKCAAVLSADATSDVIKRGSMQRKAQTAFMFFRGAVMRHQRRKPCAQHQAIWPDCVPLAVPIGLRSPDIQPP